MVQRTARRRAAVGWDWAGVNLDDGGALTVFRLRDAAGNTRWAGGSRRWPDGRQRVFGPEALNFAPVAIGSRRTAPGALPGGDGPSPWAGGRRDHRC